MYLVVDAAVAHEDLERALVTPVLVPGVNTEPVVLTIFDTPADDLDGMTTESITSHVLVHSRRISLEVFINSESSRDRAMGHDLHLNVVNSCDSIGRSSFNLVVAVVDR